MSKRDELLESLAKTIADYRQGEIQPRTPALINEWLQQFPHAIQDSLLSALNYVLCSTYISRDIFREFLKKLASTKKLSSDYSPRDYWLRANLLNIQQGGNSQKELLEMFDEVLREIHGFGIDQTGMPDGDFIYLDDCIGTGSRLRSDVCNWLEGKSLNNVNISVITAIIYTGSWWFIEKIRETSEVDLHRIALAEMENRREHRDQADVLWPASIPSHDAVRQYCTYLEGMGYPPVLRSAGNPGLSGIFRDDDQKILLEEVFLIRGCEVRKEQINLPEKFRPLGYSHLRTPGFGSMFVTYRNCPNNCPLALWAEQEDYPALFPRKTNTETSLE